MKPSNKLFGVLALSACVGLYLVQDKGFFTSYNSNVTSQSGALSTVQTSESSMLQPLQKSQGVQAISAKPSVLGSSGQDSSNAFVLDIKQPNLKALVNASKIIDQRVIEMSPQRTSKIALVNTDLKYPYIRIETLYNKDQVQSASSIASQVAMVADHMVVKKTTRLETDDEFTSLIESKGLTIRKKFPGKQSDLFIVSDSTATLDSIEKLTQILQTVKDESYIEFFEPDYLGYNANITNSSNEFVPNDDSWSQLWGLDKIEMPKA